MEKGIPPEECWKQEKPFLQRQICAAVKYVKECPQLAPKGDASLSRMDFTSWGEQAEEQEGDGVELLKESGKGR